MIKKTKMSNQKLEWPSQILQALYNQHPYLILDDAKVVINDLQKNSDNRAENYTGIIYAIAGQNILQIPFVIKDGYLYPMDIIYDEATDQTIWLTKNNFYKLVFSQSALGNLSKGQTQTPQVNYTDTSNNNTSTSFPEMLDRAGLVYGDNIGKVVVAHIIPNGRLRNVEIYENMEKKATYNLPRAEVDKLLMLHGLKPDKEVISSGGFISNKVKLAEISFIESSQHEYTVHYLNGTSRKIKEETETVIPLTKTAKVNTENHVISLQELKPGQTVYLKYQNDQTEPLKIEKIAEEPSRAVIGYGLLSNMPFILRLVKTANHNQGFTLFNSNKHTLIIATPKVEIVKYEQKKQAQYKERQVFSKITDTNTIIMEQNHMRQPISPMQLSVKLASFGLNKDAINKIIGTISETKKLVIEEPEPPVKIASATSLLYAAKKILNKVAEIFSQNTKLANMLPDASTVINKLEATFDIEKDYKDIDAIVESTKQLINRLIAIYWNLLTTEDKQISIEIVRDAIDNLEQLRDNLEQFSYVKKFEPPSQIQ